MGEAGTRRRSMENFSVQIEKYPIDLLKRFGSSDSQEYLMGNEDSEEIELNLGLSLGGRFGIDKDSKNLMRSSSVVATLPVIRDIDLRITSTNLMRTASLPTETEEQWRKRKELQSLRRMEAKRRRCDKQRVLKDGGVVDKGLDDEVMRSNLKDKQQFVAVDGRSNSMVGVPIGLPGPVLGDGSVESRGGSLLGLSVSKSRVIRGSSGCEARSPIRNQSTHEQTNTDLVRSSGSKQNENEGRTPRVEMNNTLKKLSSVEKKGKEVGTNAMDDMPCVFTKGDGPNGRRVDGILYKYGKGEEVRIMCVCHGSFLSPAEFVKHSGGLDVAHPLKHIVVNPSATSFV